MGKVGSTVTVSVGDLRSLIREEVGTAFDEKVGAGYTLTVSDFVRRLKDRGITVAESTVRSRCNPVYERNGKEYVRRMCDILKHTGNGKSLRIYVSELSKF